MSACGHDHGDDLEAHLACEARERLGRQLDACMVVAIQRDDGSPVVSMRANSAGLATLIRGQLEHAMRHPRPSACAGCADAWDRMAMALKIFDGVQGRC